MLVFPGNGISVGFLFLCLACFGSWPCFRKMSGLPFPQFASVSLITQTLLALFWLFSMGQITGSGDWADDNVSTVVLAHVFDEPVKTGAVFLGGFTLGHSDMIGSWCMQFLPAGISFALYGCTSLVGSSLLNVCIQGSRNLGMLLVGIVFVLLGKICLACAASSNDKQSRDISGADGVCRDEPLCDVGQRTDMVRLSFSTAASVCVAAGLLASLWSPLGTFARTTGSSAVAVRNSYVCLVVFALGELLALPSLLTIARFGLRLPLRVPVAPRQVLWAALSGAVVSTGYICYFLASTGVPSAVAFGIGGGSAPLMAVTIDVALGEFRGLSKAGKCYLASGMCSLVVALGVLASVA
eukprot:TRINITY_DN62634_c0_g1_i1.p1 TRINITY_DN62634_c0_g1~~TRINITY_DN62634_c0_g1_i1.p1  ORF type:complete len:354 (-),score=32.51 TRINITY_DN62634_c0_g1_i1:100-1161(-)